MPTYDYQCTACGHLFEVFQRMSDEPGADCPECRSKAERKISGGSGFLFRGEGFYITDSRSEDYKKKAAADVTGRKPTKPAEKADSGAESLSSSPKKDSGSDSSTSSTSSTKSSSDD